MLYRPSFPASSTTSLIPNYPPTTEIPLGIHLMQPRFPLGKIFATPGAIALDVAPSPQSQSFSRSYESILPNSLNDFLLVDQRLLTLET